MKDFELLPHTADIKLRVFGKDVSDLFRNALVGMFQCMRPDAENCRLVEGRTVCDVLPIERKVIIENSDMELLLVDYLSEALYLSDVYNEAYLDADIKIVDRVMHAALKGVSVTRFEGVEIKAVTYHELDVQQTANGWQADVIFDI